MEKEVLTLPVFYMFFLDLGTKVWLRMVNTIAFNHFHASKEGPPEQPLP